MKNTGKEGKSRWETYCKRQAETNTFAYKKEKHGWSEDDFKRYNKSRAVTLENLTAKYGEQDGIRRWKDYCERQSYTKSLQYFIDSYGEELGKQKFNDITAKKLLTKENFIRKWRRTDRIRKMA